MPPLQVLEQHKGDAGILIFRLHLHGCLLLNLQAFRAFRLYKRFLVCLNLFVKTYVLLLKILSDLSMVRLDFINSFGVLLLQISDFLIMFLLHTI